ncbi:Alpha/Beta hydrolase protein, partial [Mycena epipterygia]
MTQPFSLLSLAQTVDPLTSDNWHTFKDEILIVFNADGESADIVNGTTKRPTEAAPAAAYDKKDKAAMTVIWARMSKEVRPLSKGITSGSKLYAALKAKYEASTWSRRVTLRTAFHQVSHDTSKPVEDYVQKVSDLRDQLIALGETVSDNYFKDVLLANLDPLYVGIRNTLLSQPKGESDLDDVKSVISGATYIVPDSGFVKVEPEESALATRSGGGGRKVFASSGSGSGKSGHHDRDCAAHTSATFFSLAATKPTSPIVSLNYGTFQGAYDGNLTKFLGVPFSSPTARFKLPQDPAPLDGLQNATAFGPACPQQACSPFDPQLHFCLTLDVFTPAGAHPGSKLPILVVRLSIIPSASPLLVGPVQWLFGGGFEDGGSMDADFRGTVERSILVGEPVIIVAPNYRVSAFGFLAGKEVSDAGIINLGMRDQIFALEWVQKHIAAFGGDTERVRCPQRRFGLYLTPAPLQQWHLVVLVSRSIYVTDGQSIYDELVVANNCTKALNTLDCNSTASGMCLLTTSWRPSIKPPTCFHTGASRLCGDRAWTDIILSNPIESIPILAGDADDEGTLFALSNLNITTDGEFIEIAELYPQDPTQGSPFGTGLANQLINPEFKGIAAFEGDFFLDWPPTALGPTRLHHPKHMELVEQA